MTLRLPTMQEAKKKAKQLRQDKAAEGTAISHAQALETVAHHHGFRDWNTFQAAIKDRPPNEWHAGQRVKGHYLSQPFTATVLSVESLHPGWFRLVIDLDEAVDVVTFESFSNLRKRLRAVIGPDGYTKERTSGGRPHLQLDM